jgi:hypothetical protein
MTKDLHTNIAVVSAIAAAVLSADETGAALDRQGFDSAAFAIVTGAVGGAGDFAARMQHSDTETPGDFEDVPTKDLQGELPATLLADGAYSIGYSGSKRYLRLVITHNGGTSIALGATLIKGHPALSPAT